MDERIIYKEISLIPENKSITTSGRILYRDQKLCLLHSASYVELVLEGTFLEGEFCSEGGADDYQAWIGVYVNDSTESALHIPLVRGKHKYLLWKSPDRKKVKIRIVKLTECQFADAKLVRLCTNSEAEISAAAAKPRRMEVIGDSITCGYGVDGNRYEMFTTESENPLKAYAVLAAERLNFEYTLTAWSGSGLISGWVPEDADDPNTRMLVPALYRNKDYHVFRDKGGQPLVKHVLTGQVADVIVINLGTNDASYTRNNDKRKKLFQEAYIEFVRTLRAECRKAPIICTANAMTDSLNQEIEAAVEQLRQTDGAVYYVQFSDQKAEDGYGAAEHPSHRRHQIMAEELADWISHSL